MKSTYFALAVALVTLGVIGCGSKEDAAAPSGTVSTNESSSTAELGPIATAASYDVGSKKVGDKGLCIVCSVNASAVGEEEDVKETLEYKGKTYVFCSESEKADFISDPGSFTSK